MAKKTLLELENGKIEYQDDGETKVYTYQDTPIDELTDQQRNEIRESEVMKEFILYVNGLMEKITLIFENVKNTIMPVFNQITEQIKQAEAEAEKAKKAKKKKTAKKVKKDETK